MPNGHLFHAKGVGQQAAAGWDYAFLGDVALEQGRWLREEQFQRGQVEIPEVGRPLGWRDGWLIALGPQGMALPLLRPLRALQPLLSGHGGLRRLLRCGCSDALNVPVVQSKGVH